MSLSPTISRRNKCTHSPFFPAADLEGQPLEAWLEKSIRREDPALASPFPSGEIKHSSENVCSYSHVYTTPIGPVIAIYTAVLQKGGQAYLMRVLTTPDKSVTSRYSQAMSQMMQSYLKAASLQSEQSVSAASGLEKRGGKLVVGRYEVRINRGENYKDNFEIELYPNGEWRMIRDGRENKTSTFRYNPATGALDLDVIMDLYNSDYDSDTYFFFGKDAQGKPTMYGENDYGVGVARTLARYLGPATRPSPAAAKEAADRREAEERRFKWVAAPGKGLAPAKIEGITHDGHNETVIGGMAFVETVTLLLKDGTCYSGLRCAPADLDVAASRLHEPGEWGRWRRQGGKLQARWRNNNWTDLVGSFVVPARPGEHLAGDFTTGSAINIAGNVSTFHRGISFSRDGRFQTSHSSLQTTGIASNLATGTSISAYSDDNGSIVSAAPVVGAIAPGSATVSSIKKRKPGGANVGTYQLDGYTITLRYDSGEVVRQPFFFWDAKKDYIWVGTESFDLETGR